jgi:2,3-diaminopropionate biosynthesis protein SbnB
MSYVPEFSVVTGEVVHRLLADDLTATIAAVRAAYLAHDQRQSVNPPSSFLRFPDRPDSRIIALPASLNAGFDIDGVKWIASVPSNIDSGLPRASAVLILNDQRTGYPMALLESSIISAARTAASAALAAVELTADRRCPRTVGYVGTGMIARYISAYLRATGWEFESVRLHDTEPRFVHAFREDLLDAGEKGTIIEAGAEETIRSSDLVVFATTAKRPYVSELSWLSHNPVVLHISLRDLDPEVILGAVNVVDDVKHCLTADTSPHLAFQRSGDTGFIAGTLAEVIRGSVAIPDDRPVVFSPFGLGVLDLAVGSQVFREAHAKHLTTPIHGFFPGLERIPSPATRP